MKKKTSTCSQPLFFLCCVVHLLVIFLYISHCWCTAESW